MDEDNDVEKDESEESQDYESQTDTDEENDTSRSGKVSQPHKNNAVKRRVSFKEDKENENSQEGRDSGTSDDSSIRIVFKHSNIPLAVPSQDEIISPADIYLHFMRERVLKSILKPASSVEPFLLETAAEDSTKQNPSEQLVKAVGEVVERTSTMSSIPSSERPVSRFKAARMANQK